MLFTMDKSQVFWEALRRGGRCRIEEDVFEWYLEVLPPAFMGKTVELVDGTKKHVSFGFVEGADVIVAFWREFDGFRTRFYAQQTKLVSRGS